MKHKSIVKFILLIFIMYAVYNGHKSFFSEKITNIENAFDEAKAKGGAKEEFKFESVDGSNTSAFIAGVLNKLLEFQVTRGVLKEVVSKVPKDSKTSAAGVKPVIEKELHNNISNGSTCTKVG